MTDMQKDIRTQLKEDTGGKAVLLYIFSAVITLTGLIMYYASSLTLNTLFAGIGNMYVSLIALACALGAIAGIFLFTSIENTIRSEMEENCLEALEDALIKDEETEENLYPLMKDAVHFQMKGIVQSRILLIQDIIRIIAVIFLDFRCGLILLAGIALYDFLFKTMAEKKIVSAKKFVRDLHLFPSVFLALCFSAVMIFALFEMKNGKMGLYGVIMTMMMLMDLTCAHMKQASDILSLRRDLYSISILDAYQNDPSSVNAYVKTDDRKADRKSYAMLAVSFLTVSLCALMYVYGIQNIVGYRTAVSLKTVSVWMILASLCAAVSYSCYASSCAEKKTDILMRRAASACVSLAVLVYAFRVNALLAGILASTLAAEQILIPLILKNTSERPEEDRYDHIRGAVHFTCITLIISAGVLLYWNAMASFPQVLMIFTLYLITYMHIDGRPFESGHEEDEDEQ